MAQKRKYKNPYHQTQSELAEWLSLFAHDYSTGEVTGALVERYPDRTTGDPKADHRLAKEAICTVNPNDSRYNAKKWDKQFRLTQANYLRELDQSHRQLASKAVTALNAAYDNLESTISTLSPKEQISLVPKALLTLNQATRGVRVPLPSTEQNKPNGAVEAQVQEESQAEAPLPNYAALVELVDNFENQNKVENTLQEGKNLNETTVETGISENEMKGKIPREKVELHESTTTPEK